MKKVRITRKALAKIIIAASEIRKGPSPKSRAEESEIFIDILYAIKESVGENEYKLALDYAKSI